MTLYGFATATVSEFDETLDMLLKLGKRIVGLDKTQLKKKFFFEEGNGFLLFVEDNHIFLDKLSNNEKFIPVGDFSYLGLDYLPSLSKQGYIELKDEINESNTPYSSQEVFKEYLKAKRKQESEDRKKEKEEQKRQKEKERNTMIIESPLLSLVPSKKLDTLKERMNELLSEEVFNVCSSKSELDKEVYAFFKSKKFKEKLVLEFESLATLKQIKFVDNLESHVHRVLNQMNLSNVELIVYKNSVKEIIPFLIFDLEKELPVVDL